MEKRHYNEYFYVPFDYKANMTRELINSTPETWLDFYPHIKFIEFLNKLFSDSVLNGGSKSLWLTGNFGTGKSNAALVTEKLFMDDEIRVKKWFDLYKGKIPNADSLLKKLLKLRNEGTLVVYDYDASGLGPNVDFLVRLEKGIISALSSGRYTIPASANLDIIIERIKREDKHFFELRDSMQGELIYLKSSIKTIEQLINELLKENNNKDAPDHLIGDVQKVLHKDNIFLDVNVNTFRTWIDNIISANGLKRVVYIFDEFSEFIEDNKEHLKFFEDVTENPGVNNFFLIPVTHLSINAYWSEGSSNARKANDRFHFSNLQMPNDTAFKLAAHAMRANTDDPDIVNEWKEEKDNLWDSVKGVMNYFTTDETSGDYVSRQSFYDILPIHPMTAFLLKFLSEAARSNQRSIFEYLKGSADGHEFQDFIKSGGPSIQNKQLLTADYLWKYFIERDDLGLSKEILSIRTEYSRIRNNNDFCNKEDDDEDIRVLKTVLLFCLLSRLLSSGAHDRLKPTVDNIELAFQGDGAIVNVRGIIKNLADKHCFSVVNGNIELFASSVASGDLQIKIEEYSTKFHELLSSKVEDELRRYKKSDLAKFSNGRFEIRVSDIYHTTLTNITSGIRDRYSSGISKDNGSICLWFVVAKNKEEQLGIPDKITSLLTNLKEHRIIMITFPSVTFCDKDTELWNDYVKQYANYMLESDSTAKDQCKRALETIETEWFRTLEASSTPLKCYTYNSGGVVANDTSWALFKDVLKAYVKKTLSACVDNLTEITTQFSPTGLKSWALAGLVPENAASNCKQLVNAFSKQGISNEESWYNENPDHPLAQIHSLFEKKISNTIGRGTSLSIRKVYIELQRAPYGLRYNALSAYVLGFVLRNMLTKGYQWDNKQKTGALDADTLAEIIESVVKDDGDDKIKGEKEICRLSSEERAFVEKTPKMFGVENPVSDARVEDILTQIQSRIEKISGRVPLWALPYFISTCEEPYKDEINSLILNICLAFTISSRGKTEERTNAIKDVGKQIKDNPDVAKEVSKYITEECFVKAFELYIDSKNSELISLAKEIGDISHNYCDTIKSRASESAGWLWKENDIDAEISTIILEYKIIKLLRPIMNISSYISFDSAIELLVSSITEKNKLPRVMIEAVHPELTGFFKAISNKDSRQDMYVALDAYSKIIISLFFDSTKKRSIEILKERLNRASIEENVLIEIYSDLESSYSSTEDTFIKHVNNKIDEYTKNSSALKIKKIWTQLTGYNTPNEWSEANLLPARYALIDIDDISGVITALDTPDLYSADKLSSLLTSIENSSVRNVIDAQKAFLDDIVPKKFSKLNINLSSIVGYLSSKYGKNPNKWPDSPDLESFINDQYKITFAPQVVEKIKRSNPEELREKIVALAKDNPDLGLLFLEE